MKNKEDKNLVKMIKTMEIMVKIMILIGSE